MADSHRSKWVVLKFEVILHGRGIGGYGVGWCLGSGRGRGVVKAAVILLHVFSLMSPLCEANQINTKDL